MVYLEGKWNFFRRKGVSPPKKDIFFDENQFAIEGNTFSSKKIEEMHQTARHTNHFNFTVTRLGHDLTDRNIWFVPPSNTAHPAHKHTHTNSHIDKTHTNAHTHTHAHIHTRTHAHMHTHVRALANTCITLHGITLHYVRHITSHYIHACITYIRSLHT